MPEGLTIAGVFTEFPDRRLRRFAPADSDGVNRLSLALTADYDGHQDKWVENRYGRDQSEDSDGFFTRENGLVVIGEPGKPTGMISYARKRGDSLKFNTLSAENPRIGALLARNLVELAKSNSQLRTLYATASSNNRNVLGLLDHLGFQPEALLPDQYKDGSCEVVMGMVLKPTVTTPASENMAHPGSEKTASSREFNNLRDNEELDRLFEYLSGWHDDVGRDFLEATIKGADRGLLDVARKGKAIFVAEKADRRTEAVAILDPKYDLSGAVVLTAKMGGAMKMYPLIGDEVSQRELTRVAKEVALRNKFRVIYTFSPVSDSKEAAILDELGFEIRGVLREPYKPGVDLIPWSARTEELRM
ncbi:MAG TPA: hypothetical protein VG965_01635 [Patescibacteria group bacterium]|nr:hypothetical protein [Patescibacteria group bacterium]